MLPFRFTRQPDQRPEIFAVVRHLKETKRLYEKELMATKTGGQSPG